jgi:hypothetical protein
LNDTGRIDEVARMIAGAAPTDAARAAARELLGGSRRTSESEMKGKGESETLRQKSLKSRETRP